MEARRDRRPRRGEGARGGGRTAIRHAAATLALMLAAVLVAPPALADGWLFSGAEVPQGFFATAFFEEGQTAPVSLTCAWRRDGDSGPLFLDDGDFEGVAPTTPGQIRLEISTEIAGGYGEEAPELALSLNGESFSDLAFSGDLIGYLYNAELPIDGALLEAMKAGGPLEIRSSLAPAWSTEIDARGQDALKQLVEFCGRQPQG